MELTLTGVINYLLKDYAQEIEVARKFVDKLYEEVDYVDTESYIDRGLNFIILALSEQTFNHTQNALKSIIVGKLSLKSNLLKRANEYVSYARAVYTEKTFSERLEKEYLDTKNNTTTLFSSFKTIKNQDIFTPEFTVIHRQDKNEILVTIRGTADLTDAITNMMVDNQELYIPEIGRNLKFHEGILKSSFNVLEHSVPVIDKCLRENPGVTKIVFTGHSLGGGCASVCGLLYRQLVFDENFDIGDLEVGLKWKGIHGKSRNSMKTSVFTFAAPPVLTYSTNQTSKLESKSKIVNSEVSKAKVKKMLSKIKHHTPKTSKTSATTDFVDFSALQNFDIANFQLERDLVVYCSCGNFTRMLLALCKISDLGWTKLEKVRYILSQRKNLINKRNLKNVDVNDYQLETLDRVCEWLDSWSEKSASQPGKKVELKKAELDFSQNLINLKESQKETLYQHVIKPVEIEGAKSPCFYRLVASGGRRAIGFDMTPDIDVAYECVKVKSDVGLEVLPIGCNYSRRGHVNTHGAAYYEEAFGKIR